MVTFGQVCGVVEPLVDKMMDHVTREGFGLPVIVAVNKGTPIELELHNEAIVGTDSQAADSELGADHVYQSVVVTILPKQDEGLLPGLCVQIVSQYNPDAIATIIPSVYAERIGTRDWEDMGTNPNAILVLFMHCFVREYDKAVIAVMPYVDRGVAEPGAGIVGGLRDVTFAHCCWHQDFRRIGPAFPNPFVTAKKGAGR